MIVAAYPEGIAASLPSHPLAAACRFRFAATYRSTPMSQRLLGELRWFGACLLGAAVWSWVQTPPEFGMRFIVHGATLSATLLYVELAGFRLLIWVVRRAVGGR